MQQEQCSICICCSYLIKSEWCFLVIVLWSIWVYRPKASSKKYVTTKRKFSRQIPIQRIGRGKTCRLTRPPLLQFFPFSFFPQRVAWEKFSSLIPRLQFPKKTHLRRLVTIWRSIKLTNQKMQETRHLFKKYLCTYQ